LKGDEDELLPVHPTIMQQPQTSSNQTVVCYMKLPTDLSTPQRLDEVIADWTERWNRASTMSVAMGPYRNIFRTLKLTRNKHKISLYREGESQREKQQWSDRKLWSEFKIETKRNFGAAIEIPNQTKPNELERHQVQAQTTPPKIESRRL